MYASWQDPGKALSALMTCCAEKPPYCQWSPCDETWDLDVLYIMIKSHEYSFCIPCPRCTQSWRSVKTQWSSVTFNSLFRIPEIENLVALMQFLVAQGNQVYLVVKACLCSAQGICEVSCWCFHCGASEWLVNSSPPSVIYLRQWIMSALVKIMACHLGGAKPLSEPMLRYCKLDPQEQTSVKF